MNSSDVQEMIPPARVIRERMGFHLREARVLGKLLRVAEGVERERCSPPPNQPEGRPVSA